MKRIAMLPPSVGVMMLAATLCFPGHAGAEEDHTAPLGRSPELEWPQESNVTRPWTFWHCFGNAVDRENITSRLKELNGCGFGGVLVTGLQKCNDPKAPRVPLLSAEWADLMKHTIRQARSLGMDVDMCPCTGWEWGGPWISRSDASSLLQVSSFKVEAGKRRQEPVCERRNDLQAVMGYSGKGTQVDLLGHVDANCRLDWAAPLGEGDWTLYIAWLKRGSSTVRFPTDDGKGLVVDYLNPKAMQAHLDKFATALSAFEAKDWPRAWYDDSWEAHMNWSQDGFAEFAKRRGYDLRQHLPELQRQGKDEDSKRVMRDFQVTTGEMMIDGMFKTASAWMRARGSQLCCETIDHPGNIVDMAAACDIPSADVGGGPGWFFLKAKYRADGVFFNRHKVQSSAAHIANKPLVASETMTGWGQYSGKPGYHFFNTPLKEIKEKLDLDFIGGVNQLMYHSTTYSPDWARWPGYLFHAETQVGPYNPYWSHLADLNAYASRCQAFLQSGRPDAELLFYFPYDDHLMKGERRMPATVESSLFREGYDPDYVTDRMLLDPKMVSTSGGELVSPGSRHRALVVGGCQYMDETTFQRIFDLASSGATVVIVGDFPRDVPGLFNLAERRKKLETLIKSFDASKETTGTVARMKIGSGQILKGTVIRDLMDKAGVQREAMVDAGLYSIRRIEDSGWVYFIANPPGNMLVDGWVSLGVTGESAAIFDAATGQSGIAAFSNQGGRSSVYLQIEPSGSCIVRVFKKKIEGPKWTYAGSTLNTVPIAGTWKVEFLSGGEKIPSPENISALSSWTTWSHSPQAEALKYFSGLAKYSITFDKPAVQADQWILDLGDVRNSAKVTLNGQRLGTVFGAPDFKVNAGGALKAKGNLLEVEVANLAFNRAAYLDLNNIPWRMIPPLGGVYDIAVIKSTDPLLESGLLGPVTLEGVKKYQPVTTSRTPETTP